MDFHLQKKKKERARLGYSLAGEPLAWKNQKERRKRGGRYYPHTQCNSFWFVSKTMRAGFTVPTWEPRDYFLVGCFINYFRIAVTKYQNKTENLTEDRFLSLPAAGKAWQNDSILVEHEMVAVPRPGTGGREHKPKPGGGTTFKDLPLESYFQRQGHTS